MVTRATRRTIATNPSEKKEQRMVATVIQGSFPHGLTQLRAATMRPAPPQPVQRHSVQHHAAPRPATNGEALALPPHIANFPAHGGQPLPQPVLQRMEAAFGARFHDVRVHVGRHVQMLGATAFTHGTNIHFAPGQYDPATPHGERILAHELAHVVQQRTGRVRNPFNAGIAVVHDTHLEAEADRMAQKVVRTPAVPVHAPVAQPKVIIRGKTLTPTGKMANAIWEDLKLDLLDAGISPYGLKTKHYQRLIKIAKVFYNGDSEAEFRALFVKAVKKVLRAEDELRKLEEQQKKKKKTRRTVHRFAIRRPAWPKHYRAQLGARPGDDIRHVIRNATLLRAMDRELEQLKPKMSSGELLDYYREMGTRVGVAPQEHWRLQYKAIYEKMYLNLDNLFAESGGVNQAIGFSADPIIQYGKKLEDAGDTPVAIDTVYDYVLGIITAKVGQMRKKALKMGTAAGKYLQGLNEYEQNLREFLDNLHQVWIDEYGYTDDDDDVVIKADSEDLADDLIDIGDNLGFDLILMDNVAERQSKLLTVERQLQSTSLRPGTHELTGVFVKFLRVGKISRTQRAGLVFPVGRVHRHLKQKKKAKRVSADAAVYLAAVLEYLTAEIVELAGSHANSHQRRRIVPSHIALALKHDPELSKVFTYPK
jgi:histone H3/H4